MALSLLNALLLFWNYQEGRFADMPRDRSMARLWPKAARKLYDEHARIAAVGS